MTTSVRPDADQTYLPRPSWGDDMVAVFNKRGLLFKLPPRAHDVRTQRISDHLRGFVFGAAAILALVALYVMTRGTGA